MDFIADAEKNKVPAITVDNENLITGRYALSGRKDDRDSYISYYEKLSLEESIEGRKVL